MEKKANLGIGLLLLLYITLKPIYLRSSGNLQLCDIFLLIVTMYLFFKYRGSFYGEKRVFSIIVLFSGIVGYQFLVNLFWTALTLNLMVKASLYYIFNLIAFIDCIVIGNEIGTKAIKKAIGYGCFCSLIVSEIGLLLRSGPGRSTGFFNNPNQLGYYGMMIFTFTLFTMEVLPKTIQYIMLFLCVWIIIVSASKAAFISVLVTAFVFILIGGTKNQRSSQFFIKVALIAALAGLIYVFFFSNNELVVSNSAIIFLRNRILNMSSEKDSAIGTGRGYDRIKEMGVHFLWGMGEGGYNRFKIMHGKEVHSTYAALIVSYGLIGFLGYVSLFFQIIKNGRDSIKNIVLLSGVLLYQISHNGIRNTLMWILLATMVLGNREVSRTWNHIQE